MSIIDRFLLTLAPERAERRMRARAKAQAMMNFDAASRGRRTKGWKAPATSSDAAGHGQRDRLRNLSRDFIRNRAFAARAQQVVQLNTVATGIVPSIEANAADVQNQMETLVARHLLTPAIDVRRRQNILGMQ